MAVITDAAAGWSAPVTVAATELWQVRLGTVYLTTGPGIDPDDGLELTQGFAVQFYAGVEVRYRKGAGVAPLLVREVVAP